ncbi:MAG TPA: hypothetical protein VJU58_14650 [Microbacterium sp.]|nr:hypothetical protein [Microbacterium sp.]
MSDDKKTESKPPVYMAGPAGARPVRVKMLRFRTGITCELPGGKAAATTVSANYYATMPDGSRRVNDHRYRIEYLPWVGCHLVLHYRPSEEEPSGEPVMIPREWAQWVPAE